VGDGTAAPYDLTIDDTSKVTWHPHYLEIKDYTSLTNPAVFTKLVTQGKATSEITVEAWVTITGVDGGGGLRQAGLPHPGRGRARPRHGPQGHELVGGVQERIDTDREGPLPLLRR